MLVKSINSFDFFETDSIRLCKKDVEVCHRSGPMGPPYNADCCDGLQCVTFDSGPYGRRTGECKKTSSKTFI